jgi:hypothetical protein
MKKRTRVNFVTIVNEMIIAAVLLLVATIPLTDTPLVLSVLNMMTTMKSTMTRITAKPEEDIIIIIITTVIVWMWSIHMSRKPMLSILRYGGHFVIG